MDRSTIREFEQRLLAQRSTAANEESWEAHSTTNLPTFMSPMVEAKIHQGFEAGFDAAMNRVRAMLTAMANDAILAERERAAYEAGKAANAGQYGDH